MNENDSNKVITHIYSHDVIGKSIIDKDDKCKSNNDTKVLAFIKEENQVKLDKFDLIPDYFDQLNK
jgi:hypothetical protein